MNMVYKLIEQFLINDLIFDGGMGVGVGMVYGGLWPSSTLISLISLCV